MKLIWILEYKAYVVRYNFGTKESFVAKPQTAHLLRLDPMAHIEVFPGMNHGQLLVDSPEEVGSRIAAIYNGTIQCAGRL